MEPKELELKIENPSQLINIICNYKYIFTDDDIKYWQTIFSNINYKKLTENLENFKAINYKKKTFSYTIHNIYQFFEYLICEFLSEFDIGDEILIDFLANIQNISDEIFSIGINETLVNDILSNLNDQNKFFYSLGKKLKNKITSRTLITLFDTLLEPVIENMNTLEKEEYLQSQTLEAYSIIIKILTGAGIYNVLEEFPEFILYFSEYKTVVK